MHVCNGKHRQDVVSMLMVSFDNKGTAKFGPKEEEDLYLNGDHGDISKEECLKTIKENILILGDGLSSLADIHPAWIVKELENESPKIIGIILRFFPSRHVRYILEHLSKRVKMSLPKLVESFAVPTEILRVIRDRFERRFSLPERDTKIGSFESVLSLKSDDLEVLFKDLGVHELAMAFQNIEQAGIKVLLNRMSIQSARALQQRIKDITGSDPSLLKDARYTILEVAMDQEDVEKLLLEIGIAAFSKAMKNAGLFVSIQMKLDPAVSYLFKRCIDQHVGVNRLVPKRQMIVLERLKLLCDAGEIET